MSTNCPVPSGGRGAARGPCYELVGTISHAGFSSGHRFVVGRWDESPIGPMNDVMWARPDGIRVLLVDRSEVKRFITAVYDFDLVQTVALSCAMDGDTLEVAAGGLRLAVEAGRRWRIPFAGLRRRSEFRPVEALMARIAVGVRTAGVSPTGVWEWYRADQYRRVVAARGSLDGVDLGRLVRFHQPARFGFSEPPRSPAVVRVRPLLEDRSGRLTAALFS
jgi:hypothetical protein